MRTAGQRGRISALLVSRFPEERDQQAPDEAPEQDAQRLEQLATTRPRVYSAALEAAREATERVLAKSKARKWLRVEIDEEEHMETVQDGPRQTPDPIRGTQP